MRYFHQHHWSCSNGFDKFFPLRDPGPHIPPGTQASALDLFELFFEVKWIVYYSMPMPSLRRKAKKGRYRTFMKKKVGKSAFIGTHTLGNPYRSKSMKYSQSTSSTVSVTFWLVNCLYSSIHHVTPTEEVASIGNLLSPLIDHIKNKCFEIYQPRREISINERMVKSKARCHLKWYMKNKPTKWGFKLWALADMPGYTVDFNIYTRKTMESLTLGPSHDVAM